MLLTEFKTQLKAKIKHLPHPSIHLEIYPGDTAELPEKLWKSAYGDNPVDKDKPVGISRQGTSA